VTALRTTSNTTDKSQPTSIKGKTGSNKQPTNNKQQTAAARLRRCARRYTKPIRVFPRKSAASSLLFVFVVCFELSICRQKIRGALSDQNCADAVTLTLRAGNTKYRTVPDEETEPLP
jgi:hypothetical protein